MKRLQRENSEMKSEMETLIDSLDSMREDLTTCQSTLSEKEAYADTLKEKLKCREQVLAEEVCKNSRLTAQVSEAETRVDAMKEETQREKVAMTATMREKENLVDEKRRENDELSAANAQLKRKVQDLTLSLDVVREKYRKTLLAAKAKADRDWEEFQALEEADGRPVND